MKYLVVSDNHGNREVLVALAEKYRGKVDAMFHCGDSELEPTDVLWNDFNVVTGNCDYDPRFKRNLLVSNDLDTIYLTHGHLSNVNRELNKLFYEAKEVGANIALYGHTHVLYADQVENVLIVNPGSICLPRTPYTVKTYAIIESSESEYRVYYFNEAHELVPNLTKKFLRNS